MQGMPNQRRGVCSPSDSDDALAIQLPDKPPLLTIGLARALREAITSAAVNLGLLDGADDDAAERLAS